MKSERKTMAEQILQKSAGDTNEADRLADASMESVEESRHGSTYTFRDGSRLYVDFNGAELR